MLKALLWRMDGPSLSRFLQHSSSWHQGGTGSGAEPVDGGQWCKVDGQPPTDARVRRKKV